MPARRNISEHEYWRKRLYVPAYQVKEAARYSHISPQTVANWRRRGGVTSKSAERRQSGALSYLELIELAVAAAMRKAGIKLQQIADAREFCGQRLHLEFPFAQYQFKTDGQRILMELDDFVSEDRHKHGNYIEADQGGQTTWAAMLDKRLHEFDYEHELAIKWHAAGRDKPILIDPRVAFGAPTVQGIPTWAIKGRWEAGEDAEEIADDFGLEPAMILSALQFEDVAMGDAVA